MRDGTPSITARRVAAYRLGFERVDAPYGDPAADEALARDVAGAEAVDRDGRLARYLKGRTSFFDRVVVNALERDVAQVVAVGAGYDGRPWRYAKPGVRWFEVDHPDTQGDKRERLERLGIGADHVGFVAFDLRRPGLGETLVERGYDPDASGLFLVEGVAVYLETDALAATFAELRSLATIGGRMALTSTPLTDLASHEGFSAAAAAMGEPVANDLDAAALARLLAETGWRTTEISERATRAGFLVAAPEWVPSSGSDQVATRPRPATRSRVGSFVETVFHRRGLETLGQHLASSYEIAVSGMRQLDVAVFRVERSDGEPWVARVFPSARPVESTRAEATLMKHIAEAGYPAERLAAEEPVSLHEGQAVLVTEFCAGNPAPANREGYRMLGDLLGRLQRLPERGQGPSFAGGAWHHLVFGGAPCDELEAARSLLEDARPRIPPGRRGLLDELRGALDAGEDCRGLPLAIVHADFVPANVLSVGEAPVVVDWAGAGLGPRLWSLAWLLWATGGRGASYTRAVVAGYSAHVALEPAELERLAAAVATRPLVLACWSLATGRRPLDATLQEARAMAPAAEAIAATARAAFEESPPPATAC